jgi:hypothetical protein
MVSGLFYFFAVIEMWIEGWWGCLWDIATLGARQFVDAGKFGAIVVVVVEMGEM